MSRLDRIVGRLALTSAVLGLCIVVAASELSAQSPPVKSPSAPVVTSPDTIETALLRAMLTAEREHNSALLGAVYWSLGGTATIALALLGFGWFVNFRVYERDKEALSKALSAELNAALFHSRDTLAARQRELEAQHTQWQQDTEQALRQRVASAADERFDRVTRTSETHARRFDELRLDHLLLKAETLQAAGRVGNSFTAYCDAARLAERLVLPHMVNQVLGALDKQVRSMKGVYASDINKLTSFLDKLEGADRTLIERLADALRTAAPL